MYRIKGLMLGLAAIIVGGVVATRILKPDTGWVYYVILFLAIAMICCGIAGIVATWNMDKE